MRTLIVGCFILCCGCGQSPRDIKSITLEPVAPRLGSPRNPFLVEVGKDSIVLLPNDSCYFDLFSDDNQREIRVEDIAESNDFNRLLNYVLKHQGSSGEFLSRRDTIIAFLIRPEGVETYRKAKKVVGNFEKQNEKSLIYGLPNGSPVFDSLSGKTPLVSGLGGEYKIRLPMPKDIPRQLDNRPLLQEQKVLISNGKVIPLIDPGNLMELAIKKKLEMIIQKNGITVGEDNSISDSKQVAQLITEFNKSESLISPYFRFKLFRNANNLDVELLPTEEFDGDHAELEESILLSCIRNKQTEWYLRYLVEPDSFETYRAIRKFTDSSGFFCMLDNHRSRQLLV